MKAAEDIDLAKELNFGFKLGCGCAAAVFVALLVICVGPYVAGL